MLSTSNVLIWSTIIKFRYSTKTIRPKQKGQILYDNQFKVFEVKRTWLGMVSGAHLLLACWTRETCPPFSLLLCAEKPLSRLFETEEWLLEEESLLLRSCLSLWVLSWPLSWLDFSGGLTLACVLFGWVLCLFSISLSRLPVRFLSDKELEPDDDSLDFELSRRAGGFCTVCFDFESFLLTYFEVFSGSMTFAWGGTSGFGKNGWAVRLTPGVDGLRSTPSKPCPIILRTAWCSPRISWICFVSLFAGTFKNNLTIWR